MSLETLKNAMPDYAKDIKLNLASVLTQAGAPGLTLPQILEIALGSAYATQQVEVIAQFEAEAATVLSPESIQGVKAAAVIMAMNNVYYRFSHCVSDEQYAQLPARLRMNVIGSSGGIDKVDFELVALAVSAVNNCAYCMDSHVSAVVKHGVSSEGVQSTIRIAAVVAAVAQVAVIDGLASNPV